MNKIIDKYWYVFGYEIHLRILPKEFRDDLKHLHRLADDRKFEEGKIAMKIAYEKWGYGDPDLIRVDTFMEFMTDND